MRIKLEHLLIVIIVLIGLHLLMNRCRCNGFSVGIVFEDKIDMQGDLGRDRYDNRILFINNNDNDQADEDEGQYEERFLRNSGLGGGTIWANWPNSMRDLREFTDSQKLNDYIKTLNNELEELYFRETRGPYLKYLYMKKKELPKTQDSFFLMYSNYMEYLREQLFKDEEHPNHPTIGNIHDFTNVLYPYYIECLDKIATKQRELLYAELFGFKYVVDHTIDQVDYWVVTIAGKRQLIKHNYIINVDQLKSQIHKVFPGIEQEFNLIYKLNSPHKSGIEVDIKMRTVTGQVWGALDTGTIIYIPKSIKSITLHLVLEFIPA